MTMEEYENRLEPELLAFIAETHRWFPPQVAKLDLAEQRAIYAEMCHHFRAPQPENVTSHDIGLDVTDHILLARHYQREGPAAPTVILYFHGGGFMFGDLDSHGDICADLCAGTGFDVLSVDYRLAPEHPHPAAFDDACAAFDWLAATTDQHIILSGESAGGNLAAAVAAARRDHPHAAVGQMLFYPSLGGDRRGTSYRRHTKAPLLTVADLDFYDGIRGGARDRSDSTRDPLANSDFSRLPSTVIFTAECDPLSSDGEAYRNALLAAGGKAAWVEGKDLVHSFLRARHLSPRAGQFFSEILAASAALGAGRWPYGRQTASSALAAR